MPNPKDIYHLKLVHLDCLREGSIRLRILRFHEMFGSRDGMVQVWDAKDICVVIGHVGENGVPTSTQVSTVSRHRRELARQGRLRRVRQQVQPGLEVYGWGYVPQNNMTAEALKEINRRSNKITMCNPADRPRLLLTEKIGNLPRIRMLSMNQKTAPRAVWFEAMPELLDFSLGDTVDFWTVKAPSTLAAKGHPLRRIEDPDIRLQVGLACLERGLRRNVRRTPGYRPRHATRWALSHMKKVVDRERDWSISRELEQEIEEAWHREGELLEDHALEVLHRHTHEARLADEVNLDDLFEAKGSPTDEAPKPSSSIRPEDETDARES